MAGKRNKKAGPKVQTFKLSEIKPAKYNPRTITDNAMEGLTNSIRKFGCVESICVAELRIEN